MAAVDQVIRQRLSSDVVLIGQIAEYIIQSGGKRVRPALLLMVSGALSAHLQKTACLSRLTAEHAAIMAAVVEFIHTATLLTTMSSMNPGFGVGGPRPMYCSAMLPAFWWVTFCIPAHSR